MTSNLPRTFPSSNMAWVIEVESSHHHRVEEIITSLREPFVAVLQSNKRNVACVVSKQPVLIFLMINILLDPRLPVECFKYISRVFYVPHVCSDLRSVYMNPNFHGLSYDPLLPMSTTHADTVKLKAVAAPKQLEFKLIDFILDFNSYEHHHDETSTRLRILEMHPTLHNYVFFCTFSPHEGLFRWGISTTQFCEQNLMTTEALAKALKEFRSSKIKTIEPASRAFFKLEEIINHQMPSWGWSWPQKDSISIDVGASPGGWTQCLSVNSRCVLAIDPGKLREDVLGLKNVVHIQAPAQDEGVKIVLRNVTRSSSSVTLSCSRLDSLSSVSEGHNGDPNNSESTSSLSSTRWVEAAQLILHNELDNTEISRSNNASTPRVGVIVCDINAEAWVAGTLLRDHILPFVEGFGFCCQSHKCTCAENRASESIPPTIISTAAISAAHSVVKEEDDVLHGKSESGRESLDRLAQPPVQLGPVPSGCCSYDPIADIKSNSSSDRSRCVVLVITLKLLKGPKQRHINTAVEQLLECLAPVVPCPRCCTCSGQDKWRWAWGWRRQRRDGHAAADSYSRGGGRGGGSGSHSSDSVGSGPVRGREQGVRAEGAAQAESIVHTVDKSNAVILEYDGSVSISNSNEDATASGSYDEDATPVTPLVPVSSPQETSRLTYSRAPAAGHSTTSKPIDSTYTDTNTNTYTGHSSSRTGSSSTSSITHTGSGISTSRTSSTNTSRSRRPAATDEESVEILGEDCKLLHLCANSSNERTLVLRRLCGP